MINQTKTGSTEVTFTSTEKKQKTDEIVLTVHFQITEYSEFEGIHKDHEVHLLSEQPIQGLNPQAWCYLAPGSNQLSYSQGCQRFISQSSKFLDTHMLY